jgi:hypothetical protein
MIEFHLQSIPESYHPETGKGLSDRIAALRRSNPATAHVCFGSKADIGAASGNVRFTPKSRHWLSALRCPLCAKSRHPLGSSASIE